MIENKLVKHKLYLALYTFFIGLLFIGWGYSPQAPDGPISIGFVSVYFFIFSITVLISALIDYLQKRNRSSVKVLSDKQRSKYFLVMLFSLLALFSVILWSVIS